MELVNSHWTKDQHLSIVAESFASVLHKKGSKENLAIGVGSIIVVYNKKQTRKILKKMDEDFQNEVKRLQVEHYS